MWGSVRQAVAIPTTGQPISTTVQAVSPRAYRAGTLRLEFSTPPWVEVDAVRVWGNIDTPTSLGLAAGAQQSFGLVYGTGGVASLTILNTGTATLHWTLAAQAGFPWVTPLNTSGAVLGQAR